MNKQKSVVYPEVENISLERVSKMIGTYGNKSMSNEFLKDKEMAQLLKINFFFGYSHHSQDRYISVSILNVRGSENCKTKISI